MLNYLIVEDFSGNPAPFIFPAKVSHEDMAAQLPYGKLLACGQVAFSQDGFVCSGGCVELNLRARPDKDRAILDACLSE